MNYYGRDWRGSKWVTLDWEIFSNYIPGLPACYVVYLDGVLSYVGQTHNLRERLKGHRLRHGYAKNFHTPWGSPLKLVIKARFPDRHGDWAMRELRLLKRLKPGANKRDTKHKRVNLEHPTLVYLRRGVFTRISKGG